MVYAKQRNGKEPAREYYDSLSTGDRAKFGTLFALIAQFGQIKNSEKFRPDVRTIQCHENGKATKHSVAEFKIHSGPGHRIMACLDGRAWVLTHGFKKGSDVATEGEKAGRIFCEDLSLRRQRADKRGGQR